MLLERGDLRQSINSLQSFSGLASIPPELLPMTDKYGENILVNLSSRCGSIKEVYNMGKELKAEGYACDEILNSLQRGVLKMEIEEKKKGIMLELISRAEESLLLGATELPIIDVLTSLFFVLHNASL